MIGQLLSSIFPSLEMAIENSKDELMENIQSIKTTVVVENITLRREILQLKEEVRFLAQILKSELHSFNVTEKMKNENNVITSKNINIEEIMNKFKSM
uniref:Uncharacterized protein n=1 Tax=Strongyloides papillosus TaxID=174720 RepID=A0A0N5BJZ3_STREA